MRVVRPVLFAVLAIALVPPAAAAAPDASALLGRCSVAGKERRLGPTYVTALSTSRVSCRSGERVVRSFHRCRRAGRTGSRGRCRRSVSGYRCSERVLRRASTQFDSRVTCRRGSRRVTHEYTQFT
jgi:hypothetical protein